MRHIITNKICVCSYIVPYNIIITLLTAENNWTRSNNIHSTLDILRLLAHPCDG